jgi:undecaprenyl phosphate-alpha-L-ara4N flippase subunit ArnE
MPGNREPPNVGGRSRKHALSLIAVTVLLVSAAQLGFRMSAGESLVALWVALGVLCQVGAFVLTLLAYRHERVSVLFPLTALSIPLTVLAGMGLFGELVNARQWLGVLVIVVGAMAVGHDTKGLA